MTKPTKSSVLELCAKRNKLLPEWSQETNDFVDELYSRLEYAETEVEIFDLRLKKQWTDGSNLYSQKEVDALKEGSDKAYEHGYKHGYGAGFYIGKADELLHRELFVKK